MYTLMSADRALVQHFFLIREKDNHVPTKRKSATEANRLIPELSENGTEGA